MKNGIMKNGMIVFIAILLVACSSSNDVVHSGFLQKRKYNKGYNLNFKKKIDKEAVGKQEELALVQANQTITELKDSIQVVSNLDLVIENETVSASVKKNEFIKVRSVLEKAIIVSELKENSFVIINEKESEIQKRIFERQGTVYAIAGTLFTIGLVLVVLGAVLFGFGFLSFLLGGTDLLIYIGSAMVSIGLVSLVVSAILAAGKALEKPVTNVSKKINKGKEKRQKAFDELPESEKILIENKAEKRTRILSNVFTWATVIFPFFIIPAIFFNILVMKQNKANKKRKNKAIWRLVALPFLAFIGLVIFLGILESAGVITSTAA